MNLLQLLRKEEGEGVVVDLDTSSSSNLQTVWEGAENYDENL